MNDSIFKHSRSWLLAAGIAASLAGACGGEDDPVLPFEDQVLVSYEAIPSAQLDTWGDADLGAASYQARAALTHDIYQSLWPDIVAAVAVDSAGIETQETPGGYLLATNPSLQSSFSSSLVARDQVERFAAAQGYVFRQWDILITDFGSASGNTGYGVVEIAGLTPERAQAFFEHAAGVEQGLGGGYTAFGDTMLFLNLRDTGTDEPYSGLEDAAFLDALDDAAKSFAAADAVLVDAGERAVEAWFVSNDWDASPAGEDFAALLDQAVVQALDEVRARHDDMVGDWVTSEGLAAGAARALSARTLTRALPQPQP